MNVKKIFYSLFFLTIGCLPLQAGQVSRKQLIDLGWRFHLGDHAGAEAVAFDDRGWSHETLPHDWSARMPVSKDAPAGNDGGYYPTGVGWYRKTLRLSRDYEGKKKWLYFEGVYQDSKVYVNGRLIGGHPYGYSSFYCDATDYLHRGDNIIAVRADNSRQKNCRWYSGSGIYRHVWLVTTDKLHIRNWGVQITTPDPHHVQVRTTIDNESIRDREVSVRTRLSDGSEDVQTVTIPSGGSREVEQRLRVAEPELWSPDHPYLYRARVSLSTGDEVEETFGIRTISYTAQQGLLLNGTPLLLNGGCVHHDNGILGAAGFDRADERCVEQLKAAGYNAVRTSHNPPTEAFLHACDRLGLLVIDEAFDGWRDAKNTYDYSTLFDKWYAKDIEAMVRRDRNHPSIFCWSIGNEVIERKKLEVVTTARRLRDEVRRWDDTRPVTSALASWDKDWEIYDPLAAQLDIVGYNYLIHKAPADHLRVPDRVMMQTESYPRDAYANWAMAHDSTYIIGDFVWTAIDYLGESGIGRWWYEGDVPGEHYQRQLYPWHAAYCGDIDLTGWLKPVGHYRNLLWNGTERLYMAVREPEGWQGHGRIYAGLWGVWPEWESWTWPGWEGRPVDVVVYSRHPRVRLYLNDKLVGEKAVGRDTEFKAVFTLPYQPGMLRAEGLGDSALAERVELSTASTPTGMRLTADRLSVKADAQGLSFVTVELTDSAGHLSPNADTMLSFSVEGPGTLLATGTADIKDTVSYATTQRRAWKGRALAVIRSTTKAGNIRLRVSASGMQPQTVNIKSIR
ncbi:MAG: DUF4982 domain-containing protein [Prevotella sp.]|nr:DUF4982 domain-containing protein [Prevotella sp.]